MKFSEKHLSRKFILALMSVISASVLVYIGSIGDGVYSAVMLSTIAAYLTANVVQKRDENLIKVIKTDNEE